MTNTAKLTPAIKTKGELETDNQSISSILATPTDLTLPKYQQLYQETFKLTLKVLSLSNTMSKDYIGVISATCDHLARQVCGVLIGRYVIDLDAGLGKTTAVKCLIASMHKLGMSEGLLITSAKIQPNQDIIADLQTDIFGVPADLMGAFDSSEFSIPKEDRTKTQFLFVCHARFQSSNRNTQKWIDENYTFNGVRRSLCLYDEAIETTKYVAISYTELTELKNHVEFKLRNASGDIYKGLKVLLTYLEELLGRYMVSLNSLEVGSGRSTIPVQVRHFQTIEEDRLVKGLLRVRYVFGKRYPVQTSQFNQLLDLRGMVCRLVTKFNWCEDYLVREKYDYTGIVASFVIVPEDIDSICCLDASFTVDLLSKLDTSIQLAPFMHCKRFRSIKRYDNVTMRTARIASGKDKLQEEFSGPLQSGTYRHSRLNSLRDSWDKEEFTKALIFGTPNVTLSTETHEGIKYSTHEFRELLAEDMDKIGIDSYDVCTWGSQTTSNAYKDCDLVQIASTHNIPQLNAAYSAQSKGAANGDAFYDYSEHSNVSDIVLSGKIVDTYQGCLRSVIRTSIIDSNGQAQAPRAILEIPDGEHVAEIRAAFRKLLPGIRDEEWDLEGSRKWRTNKEEVVNFVFSKLDELLEEGVTSITSNAFKKRYKLTDQTRTEQNVFSRAVTKLFNSDGCNWSKKGRAWVYKSV